MTMPVGVFHFENQLDVSVRVVVEPEAFEVELKPRDRLTMRMSFGPEEMISAWQTDNRGQQVLVFYAPVHNGFSLCLNGKLVYSGLIEP